jgi:hypothetical protein
VWNDPCQDRWTHVKNNADHLLGRIGLSLPEVALDCLRLQAPKDLNST